MAKGPQGSGGQQDIVVGDAQRRQAATASVIVTYGRRVAIALDAVAAAREAGSGKIILVSNGLLEEDRQELASRLGLLAYPVELVATSSNLGSAGGYAAGLRAAVASSGTDYVWLLDDDNRPISQALREAFLEMLRHEQNSDPGTVAVSCARPADHFHKALLAGSSAAAIYDRGGAFNHFDIRRAFPKLRRDSGASQTDLPWAPFGGLLVPVKIAQIVGLPRSDFVLYEDDVEYTLRFHRHRCRIVFAAGAVVWESDKMSAQQQSRRRPRAVIRMLRTPPADHHRLFYQTRNRVYLDVRFAPLPALPVLAINSAVYLLAVSTLMMISARNRTASKPFYRAVVHGIVGRLGPTTAL